MSLTNISHKQMDDLLRRGDEERLQRRLDYVYKQIPACNCDDNTRACFTTADVYLSEFVNIYLYTQKLPVHRQKEIAARAIRYELLSLASLDYKCPFFADDACIISEVKPAQCRFFGIYPDDDYKKLKEESRQHNIALAKYYARTYRLLLPKEVMTYDVEQCQEKNTPQGGNKILTQIERDLIYNKIVAINSQVLPEDIVSVDEDELNHFTYLYSITRFTEEELRTLRVDIIREFLTYKTRTKLDSLIKSKQFDFGLAEVRSIGK